MFLVATVTDTQLLTTCITLLGILAATIITYRRVGHTLSHLDDMRDVLLAEIRAGRADCNAHFDALEAKMDRFHEALTRMLADMENRFH